MTDFLDFVNRMGLVVIPSSGGHLLIEGDVDLSGSDIATLPDNLTIVGSLIARECTRLLALPAGLDIMDSLDLRNTPITSLPADIGVGLDIMLENTGLISLPANLAVDGVLDLEGTPIAALPATLSVGGYLNPRNTAVTELPEDWCIDGPLLLDVEKICSPLAWRRLPLASLTPDDHILQDYFLSAAPGGMWRPQPGLTTLMSLPHSSRRPMRAWLSCQRVSTPDGRVTMTISLTAL